MSTYIGIGSLVLCDSMLLRWKHWAANSMSQQVLCNCANCTILCCKIWKICNRYRSDHVWTHLDSSDSGHLNLPRVSLAGPTNGQLAPSCTMARLNSPLAAMVCMQQRPAFTGMAWPDEPQILAAGGGEQRPACEAEMHCASTPEWGEMDHQPCFWPWLDGRGEKALI